MHSLVVFIAFYFAILIVGIATMPWQAIIACVVAIGFRNLNWWLATIFVCCLFSAFSVYANSKERQLKDEFWIASLERSIAKAGK